MNHRTGRLTWRDFEPAHAQPAPAWFTGPIEIDSGFGVVNPGRSFRKPSRVQRTPARHRRICVRCASLYVASAALAICAIVRWFV